MPNPTYFREFSDDEIKGAVAQTNRTGKIIAEVLVSAYSGRRRVNIMDLDGLDEKSFNMAKAIIGYRRTRDWSDQEFFALASFAAAKYNIKL